MRIAYFLSRFPNLTTTFTFNEMLSLKRQGHVITTVSLRPPVLLDGKTHSRTAELCDNLLEAPLNRSEVWVQFLAACIRHPLLMLSFLGKIGREAAPNPFAIYKGLYALVKAPLLANRILANRIDHLHADFASLPATAAMFVSKLTRIPFSFTCHAFDLHAKNWKVRNSLMPSKLREAAVVVTEHAHGRNYLIERYGKHLANRILVVRTGVDLSLFSPHDRPPNPQVELLTVARLAEKKGIRYLVEACAELARRGCEFHCTIIGDGPLANCLHEQVKQSGLSRLVEFTGAMTHDQIMDWFDRADIFVLPCIVASNGDMDGIPTVLIEAMACGIATISTPIAGIPELILHGQTGLLVPPHHSLALADEIESLVRDPSRRRALALGGRRHVEYQFDSVMNAKRMADIFSSRGHDMSIDPLYSSSLNSPGRL